MELNETWVEEKNRSVGYMISYKWFQSWCTYMFKEYNLYINDFTSYLTYNKTLKTIKTLKTKKTIKSLKSGKSINSQKSHKKLQDGHRLRHLPLPPSATTPYSHFNLIHNNIGDKPSQICNTVL